MIKVRTLLEDLTFRDFLSIEMRPWKGGYARVYSLTPDGIRYASAVYIPILDELRCNSLYRKTFRFPPPSTAGRNHAEHKRLDFGLTLTDEKIVHVVPVGFEEDRAVSGLMELGASDIYLLIDEKQGSWGENARRHAERVEERLNQVFLDPSHLQKFPSILPSTSLAER